MTWQRVEVGSFAAFRQQARRLLARGCSFEAVRLCDATEGAGAELFAAAPTLPADPGPAPRWRLPRVLASRLEEVACHRDPGRWQLCYQLLWRQLVGGEAVLEQRLDPAVMAFERLVAQVRADVHRCHAFVRFHRHTDAQGELWLAHHEPDHDILPLALPFFVRRLGATRWQVASRRQTGAFDGQTLRWLPGRPPPSVVADEPDEGAGLWAAYYQATFNPARVNPRLLRQHMPTRFWRHLPETRTLPALLRGAGAVAQAQLRASPCPRPEAAAPAAEAQQVPASPARGLAALAGQAAGCEACPWAARATQAVFGHGPADAQVMLVGEQPGDREDEAGRPFVGPAGQLLRAILADVQLDPEAVYLTNAVKHFKFTPRGKRRLHQRPAARDIATCRPFLAAELQLVRPRLVVALGRVAAEALFGRALPLASLRGRPLAAPGSPNTWVTNHPAALLRLPEAEAQQAARRQMVGELALALASLGPERPASAPRPPARLAASGPMR